VEEEERRRRGGEGPERARPDGRRDRGRRRAGAGTGEAAQRPQHRGAAGHSGAAVRVPPARRAAGALRRRPLPTGRRRRHAQMRDYLGVMCM
jgi:hypothetical protein